MPQNASLNRNLSSILQRKINSTSPVKIRAAPKIFFMDLCGREEFGNLVTWTILPSDVTQTSVCALFVRYKNFGMRESQTKVRVTPLLRFDRHPRDVRHRNPFNLSCLQHDH